MLGYTSGLQLLDWLLYMILHCSVLSLLTSCTLGSMCFTCTTGLLSKQALFSELKTSKNIKNHFFHSMGSMNNAIYIHVFHVTIFILTVIMKNLLVYDKSCRIFFFLKLQIVIAKYFFKNTNTLDMCHRSYLLNELCDVVTTTEGPVKWACFFGQLSCH